MAKTVKPLNDTQIKQAKPKESDHSLSDGDGLYLLIKSNGSKIWRFNYVNPINKKRNLVSFGHYPETTLLQARQKRHEYRSLVSQGIDPVSHFNNIKQSAVLTERNTFKNICLEWLELQQSRTISAGTKRRIENSFINHLFPVPELANKPISEITALELEPILRQLEQAGHTDTVKRLCQRVNRVMDYAVNKNIIEYNKLSKITNLFAAHQKENFPTLPPNELNNIFATINRANLSMQTKCLIEFQILTLARPGEAVQCEWSEIDFDNNIWTIPADKMKRKRDHLVPLSKQAINILNIMKNITNNPKSKYVFASFKAPYLSHMSKETVNTSLKRMGFKGKLVAHGFRSLASTALNESKLFDAELIEVSLSHVDKNAVRATYNKAQYLDIRRNMLEWWGDFVEQASKGNLSLSGS